MNLTEEKCRDSLSNLYYVLQGRYCDGCNYNESEFCAKCNIKEDLHVMRKLIHEHFCNTVRQLEYAINQNTDLLKQLEELKNPQPYKFEDLQEGMWVWDDEYKQCIKIKLVFMPCKEYQKGSLKIYHNLNEDNDLDFVEFEENRFFPVNVGSEK